MIKFTRKDWLEELLIGLFEGKHVKVDDVYITNKSGTQWYYNSILYDKGWLQSVKTTDKYHNNYIKLMKRALLDDAVFFNENWTIREGFDRQRIIDNAKRYFKKYGFYGEKYSSNYSTSDIGRLFYKIILTEFFPIIFDKEKDMKDDISDMYNRQTDRLKHLFAAPDLEELFYINAQNKDIDLILDFCLNNNVDNADIAIPINTSSLNLGMVMPWKKNAVEIVTKPTDNQFRAWSERSDLSLDELMEKWVEYPFDPEGLFVKPWDPWLDGFVEKSEQKNIVLSLIQK